MNKDTINKANFLDSAINKCEDTIKKYKIFRDLDEVQFTRECSERLKWQYMYFIDFDLKDNYQLRNDYQRLFDNLIIDEELKLTELRKQLDEL